jgi:hypothetical protein
MSSVWATPASPHSEQIAGVAEQLEAVKSALEAFHGR